MAEITLSGAVRNNLLSLQNTAKLLGKTQERLSTGLRVGSALDDPTAFFTAQSLNSRAGDLSRLLDSVGLAVQSLESADNAITAITDLVESAQATARQAQQATPATFTAVSIVGTSATLNADVNESQVGTGTFDTSVAGGSFTVNGTTVTFAQNDTVDDVVALANTALDGAGVAITAANDGGQIRLTADNADLDITLGGTDLAAVGLDTVTTTQNVNLLSQTAVTQNDTLTVQVTGGATQTITFGTGAAEVSTLAELNTALGNLTGVTASVNLTDGNISIAVDNDSNSLTIGGSATEANFGLPADGTTNPVIGAPSTSRTNLQSQYNSLLTQIDQLAQDAGFNGINLLQGDNLEVTFNEGGTSSLTISGVDFDSAGLAINAITGDGFQIDGNIDTALGELDAAVSTLRTQASTFGSNLSVVETRQNFTENLINTLETGAANLTLADTNEEGANMLALQTRQQLSSVALSLASQADQNVLRLF